MGSKSHRQILDVPSRWIIAPRPAFLLVQAATYRPFAASQCLQVAHVPAFGADATDCQSIIFPSSLWGGARLVTSGMLVVRLTPLARLGRGAMLSAVVHYLSRPLLAHNLDQPVMMRLHFAAHFIYNDRCHLERSDYVTTRPRRIIQTIRASERRGLFRHPQAINSQSTQRAMWIMPMQSAFATHHLILPCGYWGRGLRSSGEITSIG